MCIKNMLATGCIHKGVIAHISKSQHKMCLGIVCLQRVWLPTVRYDIEREREKERLFRMSVYITEYVLHLALWASLHDNDDNDDIGGVIERHSTPTACVLYKPSSNSSQHNVIKILTVFIWY